MFYAVVAILCVALALGVWLSMQYLIEERAPPIMGRIAAIHGTAGALCVATLYVALSRPGPAVGKFGWSAFVVLAATLAGGLTILSFNLRAKPPSRLLVAIHALAGMTGAVMVAAYFSTPGSFGR
jgi:hypothetical protein